MNRCFCGDCFQCDLRLMGHHDGPLPGQRVSPDLLLAGRKLHRETSAREAAYKRASRARAKAASPGKLSGTQ